MFYKFEVREFSHNQYDSLYRSTIGQIRNSLVKAVNEHSTLPKVVVAILDNDLVHTLPDSNKLYETTHVLSNWLMSEFDKVLESYKDLLPNKAKCPLHPQFLWIAPPMHKYFNCFNNKQCLIQGQCLVEIAKTKNNMTVLQMVKFWDHNDHNSFLRDQQRFTTEGLPNYWNSIDSAVRYWDTIVHPKILGAAKKAKQELNNSF